MFKIKDFTPVISGFTNCDTPNCYKVVPLWNLRYKTKIRLRKRTRGCSFFSYSAENQCRPGQCLGFFHPFVECCTFFFSFLQCFFYFIFTFALYCCPFCLFCLSLLFLSPVTGFVFSFHSLTLSCSFALYFVIFHTFLLLHFHLFLFFHWLFLRWPGLSFVPCPFCPVLLPHFVLHSCWVYLSFSFVLFVFLFSSFSRVLPFGTFSVFFSTSFSFVWLFSPFCFICFTFAFQPRLHWLQNGFYFFLPFFYKYGDENKMPANYFLLSKFYFFPLFFIHI